MAEIRALFWDVGGVLLTNAWDHEERSVAFERFELDKEEFESRHKGVVEAFERGEMDLDEYLDATVFYEARKFSREEFTEFMFSLSKARNDMLQLARELSDRYFMGTINNESRELNAFRIEKFGMREIFKVFVSSCFVGLRKPDERMYRLASDLTQYKAEESVFIDDRAANVEGAVRAGMNGIQAMSLGQLRAELMGKGVAV